MVISDTPLIEEQNLSCGFHSGSLGMTDGGEFLWWTSGEALKKIKEKPSVSYYEELTAQNQTLTADALITL